MSFRKLFLFISSWRYRKPHRLLLNTAPFHVCVHKSVRPRDHPSPFVMLLSECSHPSSTPDFLPLSKRSSSSTHTQAHKLCSVFFPSKARVCYACILTNPVEISDKHLHDVALPSGRQPNHHKDKLPAHGPVSQPLRLSITRVLLQGAHLDTSTEHERR